MPTVQDLETLDYTFQGLPYNDGVLATQTDFLDLVYRGQPFFGQEPEEGDGNPEETESLTLNDRVEVTIINDARDSLTLSDRSTYQLEIDHTESLTLHDVIPVETYLSSTFLTSEEAGTLDYVFQALPYNDGVFTQDINLLNFTFQALPFVGEDGIGEVVDATESLTLNDRAEVTIIVSGRESLDINETILAFNSGDFQTTESLTLNDRASFTIIAEAREPLTLNDSGDAESLFIVEHTDSLDISDSSTYQIEIDHRESLTLHDDMPIFAEGTESLDLHDRVVIIVDEDSLVSMTVQIDSVIDELSSTMLAIAPYAPEPVSVLDSPDNPFLPTIAVDGEYLTDNEDTQPVGGVAGTSIYINLANPGLGDASLCGLYSYSINLTLGGGTFSFLSEDRIGSIGTGLQIFGLGAIVTEEGRHYSSSGIGWATNGIFGTRAMNKQLLLGLHQTAIHDIAPSYLMESPKSNTWTTVASAARALANAAGVDLVWMAQDAPLTDLFPQTGQTVRQAIEGLAARVSGVLVYTGATYVVVDPVRGYGSGFSLPDCRLLAPGGVEVKDILDLDTSILFFPVEGDTGAAVTRGGLASADMADISPTLFPPKPSKVESIGSMRSKIEAGQTVQYFDLPGDYREVKAQIVVEDASLVGGLVTLDSNVWVGTELSPALPVITRASGKKQVVVAASNFPSNLSDGDFSLNVGYTRHTEPIDEAFEKAREDAINRKRHLLEAQQQALRYFRATQGTINTVFFGQVPIPGGKGNITFESAVMSGMIESVNISSPGYMSLQIGRYVQTSFISPRAQLDFFQATGTPRPPGV